MEIDGPGVPGLFVREIWTSSENLWQSEDDWREIFGLMSQRALMTTEEQAALSTMPEELTVYRGTCAPYGIGSGMSWSPDRKTAGRFARRFVDITPRAKPCVLTGRMDKADAIGYFTTRSEEEVVVLSEKVRIAEVITLG